jgi:hypothetical protein
MRCLHCTIKNSRREEASIQPSSSVTCSFGSKLDQVTGVPGYSHRLAEKDIVTSYDQVALQKVHVNHSRSYALKCD